MKVKNLLAVPMLMRLNGPDRRLLLWSVGSVPRLQR